jgi:aryl-alcohol dehydrogenase (NADP+)
MEYRPLGRTGVKVSPLCLGAMMFGGEADAAESRRIIDRAWDTGVNFIDTANAYHRGRSEEVVGEVPPATRPVRVVTRDGCILRGRRLFDGTGG